MRKREIIVLTYFFVCLAVISTTVSIFAQGSNPGRTPGPKPPPRPIKTPSKTTPKPIKTPKPTPKPIKTPKPASTTIRTPKVLPARFSFTVSEPKSEIFIVNDEGSVFNDAESFYTDDNGSPLEYDDFPTGTFTLTVRKPGFFDETRQITVTGGKMNAFKITLRPFSPEKLLSDAQAEFRAQNYKKSAELAGNILAADPDHAKANLLLGNSLYNLPEAEDASVYLTRAVGGGETVSLPVRLYNKEKGDLQLLTGNLTVTKNTVEYRGNSASFVVMPGKTREFFRKTDNFGLWYIELNVEGIFDGKKTRRTVRLYSDDIDVRASKDQLMCSSCGDVSCLCPSRNNAVFQLLDNWRRGNF